MSLRKSHVILLVFSLVCAAAIKGQSAPVKLQLYSVSGELHRSSEVYQNLEKNQKIVYSFWSFSCLPCMAEFPQLLQLQKEIKSAKFYYVNVLDEKEKISEYAEKNNIDKSLVLLDERLVGAKSFQVLNKNQQPILPQLFVLDKTGKIIFRLTGYTESSMASLRAILGNN